MACPYGLVAETEREPLMILRPIHLVLAALCVLRPSASSAQTGTPATPPDVIRLGILGCDTSHVIAFTKMLNDDKDPNHVPGARVVAAFPGGSADIPSSIDRVPGYVKELKEKFGVEILETAEAVVAKADAILVESVDGRPHLDLARPVFAAKKRCYIDKPLAGSLKDAKEIARLAKESGTPFFSASSLRFSDMVRNVKGNAALGDTLGADAWSPAAYEPHHPDLFWYGVHGVETLYAFMGPGCVSVQRTATEGTDVVTGRWKDGRIGTFRGKRAGPHDYGSVVHGSKATLTTGKPEAALYRNLVVEIVKFLRGGEAPVSVEEMLEVLAFMEGADESRRNNGGTVNLEELQKK